MLNAFISFLGTLALTSSDCVSSMAQAGPDWLAARPLPEWARKKPKSTQSKQAHAKALNQLRDIHLVQDASMRSVNPDGTASLDHEGRAFQSTLHAQVTTKGMWRKPRDLGAIKRSQARADKLKARVRGVAHVAGLVKQGAEASAATPSHEAPLAAATSALKKRHSQLSPAVAPNLPQTTLSSEHLDHAHDDRLQLLLALLPEHERRAPETLCVCEACCDYSSRLNEAEALVRSQDAETVVSNQLLFPPTTAHPAAQASAWPIRR